MSRNKTLHTAWTSYAALVCTTIVALLTIKLAAANLSQEEFGLWSFTTQSVGYFLLLDFGVSNALGRLFGEPLASGDSQKINSWFTLALVILATQGLLIAVVGISVRDMVIEWFGIPENLRIQAAQLWLAFLMIQAVNLPLKITGAILYAQNRAYWANVFPAATAVLGLVAFYIMLQQGLGVLAYAWSSGVGVVVGGLLGVIMVSRGPHRFGLSLRGVGMRDVRSLFSFASAVFIVSLAVQVAFASQALIITKILGLTMGAAYAVTSRLPLLGMQLLWKPIDAFSPRWQQEFCNGNEGGLRREFTLMFRITLLLTTAGVVGLVLVNGTFVRWWTDPSYYGGNALNLLLGAFVIVQTFSHAFSFPFVLHRQMRSYTIVVCFSTVASVVAMVVFTEKIGLAGVPAGLLLGDLLLGFWYYCHQGGKLLGISAWKTSLRDFWWLIGPLAVAVLLVIYVPGVSSGQTFTAFVWTMGLAGLLSLPLLARGWQLAQTLRQLKS